MSPWRGEKESAAVNPARRGRPAPKNDQFRFRGGTPELLDGEHMRERAWSTGGGTRGEARKLLTEEREEAYSPAAALRVGDPSGLWLHPLRGRGSLWLGRWAPRAPVAYGFSTGSQWAPHGRGIFVSFRATIFFTRFSLV